MPADVIVHYNPPIDDGKCRCGRKLIKVKKWTTDVNDATCNRCLQLEGKNSK